MARCNQTRVVFVVRDASGEYVAIQDEYVSGRTPAACEAREFETREEAQEACTRTTDRVLTREV